jgi:hypothetical protein
MCVYDFRASCVIMHKFHIVGFCRHSYSGTHVSVEDSDVAWIDGEVLEVNGEEIEVLCTSGKIVSTFHNIIC